MRISPAVTSSSPARSRRIVDFPQPDGPTRTMNSPSAMSRDTSSTATTSPSNSFDTPSKTIFAIRSSFLFLRHRLALRPCPAAVPAVEPGRGQRLAGAALRLGSRLDPVEPQQRRAHHRRDVEDAHAPARRDLVDPSLDPAEEIPVSGGEDASAEHDVHVEPRHPKPADRDDGHPHD